MTEIKADNTIYHGRPTTQRSPREERVYSVLDGLKIEYSRLDHERADTIDKCSTVERLLKVKVAKNLFLCNSQKASFYMLIMPGEKPFKTKNLSKQINSARLSFAPAEFMEKYLDVLPGSMSILGLINDSEHCVRLLLDRDVLKEEYLGFHPCENTSTLKIKTDELLNVFLPHTAHTPQLVELPWEEIEQK